MNFQFFSFSNTGKIVQKVIISFKRYLTKRKKIDDGEGYCASDTVLDLIHQFKTNSAYTTELIIYIKISFTMHPFRGND